MSHAVYAWSKPVIASNLVTLALSVSILILKLRYQRPAVKLKQEEMQP
jgi:uncharacterized protein with PQ loop repeat